MSPLLLGSIVWKTCGSIDRMIGGAGHGSGVGGEYGGIWKVVLKLKVSCVSSIYIFREKVLEQERAHSRHSTAIV